MENKKEMEQSEMVRFFNRLGFFCGEDEELIKRLEEQEKQEREKGDDSCEICFGKDAKRRNQD